RLRLDLEPKLVAVGAAPDEARRRNEAHERGAMQHRKVGEVDDVLLHVAEARSQTPAEEQGTTPTGRDLGRVWNWKVGRSIQGVEPRERDSVPLLEVPGSNRRATRNAACMRNRGASAVCVEAPPVKCAA